MFLSQVWKSPVHRVADVRVSYWGERKSLRLESSLNHTHHLWVIPRILRVLKHVQQLPFCLICIFKYLSGRVNSVAGKNLHWFTIKSSLKSVVLDAVFFLAWKTWLLNNRCFIFLFKRFAQQQIKFSIRGIRRDDQKCKLLEGQIYQQKIQFCYIFLLSLGDNFLPQTWEVEVVRSDVPPW